MDYTKTLNDLIPAFATNKKELDSYKKLCEDENKQIKEALMAIDENSYEAGGYKVTMSITTPEDKLDEEKLLTILEQSSVAIEYPDLIKTKSYVDMDVLESILYNNGVPEDILLEMGKCKIPQKERVALRVSKVKED